MAMEFERRQEEQEVTLVYRPWTCGEPVELRYELPLPERMREIFKKSYIDEVPDKQIAEELNVTLNTIKTQKARAKEYLRGRLGDLFALACVIFPGL